MDTTNEEGGGGEPEKALAAKLPPRRIYPVAFKRRVVEDTLKPGASVSVVARRHDVNTNLVFGWRKLYHAGLLGGSPGQNFVQVGMVGSGGGLPEALDRCAGLMELELPGGIRLRVDSRIEEAALRRVLRAVKSCR